MPQKTEEQLKADIFNVYSKYKEEQSPDRRQVYFGQLCDSVFRWCRCAASPRFSEANEMGVEIVEALERIVKENNKTPKEEKEFFKYLVITLNNARNEFYRNNKSDIIQLPRTIYDMEKMILSQENNAGRTLSEEEKIEFISKWFNKPKEKAQKCLKYIEMIDNKNISNLAFYDNEGVGKNLLDSKDLKPPYLPHSFNDPESMFFSKINTPDFRKAVESVLQSKQERTRECYRDLFTVHCINNSIDFEGAASVLNAKILEKYLKDGKKTDQYEVYKMYHPEVKKISAEVRASEMLKTFLNDLKNAMKEKT